MDRVQGLEVNKLTFVDKAKAYLELTKSRLTLSVVYSAIVGYFLGADEISFYLVFLILSGGYLVVGAANGFNQILERDRDALMNRTKNRSLPAGKLSLLEAMIASTLMAFGGLWILYLINPLTLGFGAFALFIYVLVYTPLKTKGSIAVFVGAFPGAIPVLLGWVAATNDFDIEPGTLFALQFLWQFAHFWAIAWVTDIDYKKAGYSLLPSGQRNRKTSLQILLCSIFMFLVSVLPFTGLTGNLSISIFPFIIISLLGIYFIYGALKLHQNLRIKDARRLMIYSIIYLPMVQLTLALDKLI